MRDLDVWWDDRRVGRLIQDVNGEISFAYADDWLTDPAAPALSASLPKQQEAFSRKQCRPFFAGLLPEETQREAVARALGVSRGNDFALLERLGGDVAGAIQLLPSGDFPSFGDDQTAPVCLDASSLVSLLDRLPLRPFLVGDTGLRLSLAGAQSKIPVVLHQGKIALPGRGQPTTHILKPPIRRFPGTTENEAYVMRLADTVGLDVAKVEPRCVDGRTFLLVERYDRITDAKGITRRLHQEDMCQALGITPEMKYASEGGPTFADCFGLVRRTVARPANDVLKLLDAVIFNAVVGNADAHGKNFSLLLGPTDVHLAPLYDLLSTVVYPELSARFAMKIGKRAILEDLDEKSWASFASDAGLSAPFVKRRVKDLCDAIGAYADVTAERLAIPGLDDKTLSMLAKTIRSRAEIGMLSVTKKAYP